jgi:hypothetical protein
MMKELDEVKAKLIFKTEENLSLSKENTVLKESNKSKDKEIHILKKEAKKMEDKHFSELVELKEFKENTIQKEKERKLNVKLAKKNAEVQTEFGLNTSDKEIQSDVQYECDNCELKSTTKENINEHKTMIFDLKDKNSNLSSDAKLMVEFQKYPCYYCGVNIAGEDHLENHRHKCRGWPTSFTLYNKVYFDLPISCNFPALRMPTNYRHYT